MSPAWLLVQPSVVSRGVYPSAIHSPRPARRPKFICPPDDRVSFHFREDIHEVAQMVSAISPPRTGSKGRAAKTRDPGRTRRADHVSNNGWREQQSASSYLGQYEH